jgi:hypothetical protein
MAPQPGTGIPQLRLQDLAKAAQQLQKSLRSVVDRNQFSQAAVMVELCSLAMSRNRFC